MQEVTSVYIKFFENLSWFATDRESSTTRESSVRSVQISKTGVKGINPLVGFIFCSLFILFAPSSFADPVQNRPNIVLIISDDQAWTDYSFMKHSHIQTPRLDQLAKESLLFRRGYVPSSLCSPSLATILTGQYPQVHKVTGNDPKLPDVKSARFKQPEFQAGRQKLVELLQQTPTIPKLLQKQGYQTFQSGKWWLGHYSTGGFTHGMTHGETDKGGRHGDQGLEIGRKTMQPIYDFISAAQEKQQPFFVWYAPLLPHDPHTPPERILKKYQPLTDSIHVAKYWANVEWFDETCGALMDYLQDKKLTENTVIIYVTDNGWIQNPQTPKYAPKSKQSPYDGGLRTPIMIKWQGKIQPAESPALASSIDIFPTICHLLKSEVPQQLPGVNLLDAAALNQRKTLFGSCFTHDIQDINNPAKSLRWRWCLNEQWKLIVPATQNEPAGAIELYNVLDDPLETKNLAQQESVRVQQLQQQLDQWWKP